MPSVPYDSTRPVSTETRNDLWLICPICKQPNPAGTLHCKYCWGASLYSVTPVNNEQLTEFVEKWNSRRGHLRFVRNLLIGIGAPLLLITVLFLWVYNFTDLVFTPPDYLNSASVAGEWTMFRYNPSRTGAVDIVATNPRGELKWSFQTGHEIHSSPAIVDGVVYFGSRDFKLYALDADTGQLKWTFQADGWIESSPAVANGIVYFGSNDGKFYAVDLVTGTKLWDFQTRYAVRSSPAVAGNTVYFGGDDYFIYALDAKTGKQRWSYKTTGYVSSSPVIYNGILYVGSMGNACYALNAETGQFRLKMRVREVVSSPVVSGNTIYFTSERNLYAMDAKARNWPMEETLRPWWIQFWAFGLAPPPPPVSGVEWGLRLTLTSSNTTPIIDGTTIYTTGDSRLISVDLTTKEFNWTYRTGGVIRSSPALANDILYIGSDDGQLYAVSAEDGQPLWNFPTEGKITSSPVYVNGVIYVTSWDGKIYAIE